jgi:hypothetical protein
MGAFVMANQTAKHGSPSIPGVVGMVVVLAAMLGAAAASIGFPGAGWNVPTFGVAVLPALALAAFASGMGRSRS